MPEIPEGWRIQIVADANDGPLHRILGLVSFLFSAFRTASSSDQANQILKKNIVSGNAKPKFLVRFIIDELMVCQF